MKLNLGKLPKEDNAIWFDYDEDVSFKIRYLSPQIVRKLRMPHVSQKFRKGMNEEIVNEVAYNDDLNAYMVADWKGIEIKDGKPAECNKENIKLLFDISSDHALFVLEKAREISNFIQDKEVQELKNSKSSSTLN